MKTSILLTIAVFFAISLHSQDIYTAGYFTVDDGPQVAAVFRNGVALYSQKQLGKDFYSSAIAIDTLSGDVYWSANAFPQNSISEGCGYVMKNDEILLDNVIGTCINDISFDGDDIYSAGYMNDIYESVAAVWKNGETTPLYTYCTDKHSSVVLGIDVVDGVVYACGYYEEGLHYGCVWVNGDLYAMYPNSKVSGITYHDGDIYYSLDDCAFYDVWVRPSPLAVEEIEAEDSPVVYIYNFFGELVKTIYSDNNNLNISDLPSGFYIAKRGSEVTKFFSTGSGK